MNYPDRLKLIYLESEHPEYTASKDLYVQLTHLTQGGVLLEQNKERYLPKRAGETDEIYKTRLNKFTYTNVTSSALTQQVTKLSSGAYTINGLEANQSFWTSFREDVNCNGLSELQLLQKLFRDALVYKKLFVHVDKPRTTVQPRNKLEEERLNIRPYLTIYSACEVIDWVENNNALQMVKVKQFSQHRETLLSPPIDKVTYTIITAEMILRYSALVRLVKGKIVALLDTEGKELSLVDEDTSIQIDYPPILHRFGTLPVFKFELPDELWAGNQIYLKAKEHLVLDNVRFDMASMAYVQRILTPQITPESDLTQTYTEGETILSGNPFILKAADFKFAELKGDVLNTLTSLLADLEAQVKDTLSLGGMSADKRAIEQSGVSKKLDFALQELVLRSYGSLLLDFYQNVLQAVGKATGQSNESVSSISASGFTSFDLDNADELIVKALDLLRLQNFLTPTTFRLFAQQLNRALVPNASAEEQALIDKDLESKSLELSASSLNPELLTVSTTADT
ncbi:hypothetical protein LEP3755_34070 [Leptolyngbya sp. NIES-3755]|nr:hypothetical protein LEP3755_34070 [Leptolyngbya sp. NIES-3755]